MIKKLYEYIKNKISVIETEVWDFTTGDSRVIDPTLSNNQFAYGVGLYLVPIGYCNNRWHLQFVLCSQINKSSPKAVINIIFTLNFQKFSNSKRYMTSSTSTQTMTSSLSLNRLPGGAFFDAVGGGNTCLIYFAIAFLVRSIFHRNFWSRVKMWF